MKKVLLLCCQLIILIPLTAQNDILGGLFGKEEPQFNAMVEPTNREGEIDLNFYYTHGKVNELEISFWVMDLGTNFIADGEKKMVQGLKNIGNRREEIITIDGLRNNHFYSIGIDYRSPKGIARKFASKVILDGYHYKAQATKKEEIETPMTRVEQPRNTQESINQPCFDPKFSIRVEPSGYCQDFDRPAVLIQCENCQGKEWEFSVEVRDSYSEWESVRADGKLQPASGVSLRTEPLCSLRPGIYEVQVLAWGLNCENPVIQTLGTTINIGKVDNQFAQNGNPGKSRSEQTTPDIQSIPDTCEISHEAVLDGNYIKGTFELPFDASCAAFDPYIKVRYVHPGHRDITTKEIPLLPGGRVPFSVELDDQDLARNIHTLQGIVYLGEGNGIQDIPVSTFWMKAGHSLAYAEPPSDLTADLEPDYKQSSGEMEEKGTEEDAYESSIMEEGLEEVNVTAFDPNCTQIQDLQLVYGSGRSKTPLFISWMSPRCCQEDGCGYSVWAGPAPDQLRLLVKGNKPGSVVKELMQNARASDTYYEVVVNTGNRNRKAAYVPGEGPLYGIEEVADYHDKINPPEDVVIEVESYDTHMKPELRIEEFRSCRIFRETIISTDNTVEVGEPVTISYNYSQKGYKYTLYHQPEGMSDWFVAPDTRELNDKPEFSFSSKSKHSGKYLVLAYNPSITWGCLSLPLSEAIELKVE